MNKMLIKDQEKDGLKIKLSYEVSRIPKKGYNDKAYSLVVSLAARIEKEEIFSALVFFLRVFNKKLEDFKGTINNEIRV